jgi:anti-sigma factor RsiW
MTSEHVQNEQLISAYLDGELTSEERQHVEHLLETNADYRRFLADLRALVDELQELPKLSLDEGFVSRVLKRTQQAVPETADSTPPEAASLEVVSAYLDGELSAEELSRVQQQLETDEPARQYLQQLRALERDVHALPKHSLPEDFADRVLQRAERTALAAKQADSATRHDAPALVTPAQRPEVQQSRTPWRGLAWSLAAVAAAVFLAVVLGRDPGTDRTDIASVPQALPETDVDSPPALDSPDPVSIAADNAALPEETPESEGTSDQATPPWRPAPDETWPVVLAMQQNAKQRLILVYEVAVTSIGTEQGAFARLLTRHNIGFRDTVAVGENEQRALLKRRYLEGAKIASPVQKGMDEIRLYLVSCNGKQADSLYRDLAGGPPGFASFSLNLTSGEAGGGVLNRVCEAGEISERHSEAVRLATSFAMLSKTARNLGVFGTIGWIDPELLKGPPRPDDTPQSDDPVQSDNDVPAGQVADKDDVKSLPDGEDLQCELLFVVRNMRTPPRR